MIYNFERRMGIPRWNRRIIIYNLYMFIAVPRFYISDETVTVDLLEGGHQSTMKIIGKNDRILVQVDYDSSSNDMAIYIEGG